MRASGSYGWLGVEVFFVLSGFVIPLAIHSSFVRFSVRDFPVFMARRLFRIEPPYLVSILLVIFLWELSARVPGFAGGPPDWSAWQILSHVVYAIPLTPFDWLQPVYWTLAYEFVFYIAAGLLFRVLAERRPGRWPVSLGIVLALCLTGALPPLSLLFLMGIAVFRRLFLREPLIWTGLSIGAAAVVMVLRDFSLQAAVGAATACLILGSSKFSLHGTMWRPLMGLGAISYSLYLVHVPIGGRVVNLFGRFIPATPLAEFMLSLVALAISLIAAFLFWKLVERPAHSLSRKASAALQRLGDAPARTDQAAGRGESSEAPSPICSTPDDQTSPR